MANPSTSNPINTPREKEVTQGTWDKTRDAAQTVGDKTKDAAAAVSDLATNAATATANQVGKTAEKWTNTAASGVRHLGETIKEKGPQQGVFGDAARAVGDTIEQGGRYIEQEGLGGMMDDVTELVRRNPLPAILVGVGLGFLIGRTLRS